MLTAAHTPTKRDRFSRLTTSHDARCLLSSQVLILQNTTNSSIYVPLYAFLASFYIYFSSPIFQEKDEASTKVRYKQIAVDQEETRTSALCTRLRADSA